MNWFSRLFGSKQKEPTCFDIVSAYGEAIQSARRGSTTLLNIDDLPFGKGRIKAAIIESAIHHRDDPDHIEVLGYGFYMLGSFQAISQSATQLPDPEELEAMDQNQLEELIAITGKSLREEAPLQKLADAEKTQLLAEWKKFSELLGKFDA